MPSDVRLALFLSSAVCGVALLPPASSTAQSASSTPESVGTTVDFPNAGGSYLPSSYGSFDLFKEATGTDDVATYPEVTIHFEAGAWGSGGKEPMVFTYVRSVFDVAGEADYLRSPLPTVGYARVPCTRDVDPHCECIRPDPDECYHFTIAAAAVRRPYRLVNMSGMTLPGNVSFVPVLVDYSVRRGIDGTPQVLPGDQQLFNLSATVRASYPDGQATFTRTLSCGIENCSTFNLDDAPSRGTLEVPVALRAIEDLLLDVSAAIYVNDHPECEPVPTLPNDPCLVLPYAGDAWVHVDPYVYVDPSWEYADWFEVQTTSDGVEWLAATRTDVDLSKFGFEGGGGLQDGGVPDAGAGGMGGGLGPDAGAGGTSGSGGSGGSGPSADGGGGCAVASSSGSPLPLLLLFWAVALICRRTRTGRRREM
jgi:hypothetical protein